jgi:hypothetical protein
MRRAEFTFATSSLKRRGYQWSGGGGTSREYYFRVNRLRLAWPLCTLGRVNRLNKHAALVFQQTNCAKLDWAARDSINYAKLDRPVISLLSPSLNHYCREKKNAANRFAAKL